MSEREDPEDILFSSLETFYDQRQVTVSTSPGSVYTYTYPNSTKEGPISIHLSTPDTQASNWSLHASSIWVSSKFMADHILQQINMPVLQRRMRVLELGAGAGLPGIMMSLLHPPQEIQVLVSDYPDDLLVKALSENVTRNTNGRGNCSAVGYAWGAEFPDASSAGFDVIIAADTLWNSEFHPRLIASLRICLRRDSYSRVHLVAGLHTGRYTLASFFQLAKTSGFELEKIVEMESSGNGEERQWSPERANEEEIDRRRWVVWIILRWSNIELEGLA